MVKSNDFENGGNPAMKKIIFMVSFFLCIVSQCFAGSHMYIGSDSGGDVYVDMTKVKVMIDGAPEVDDPELRKVMGFFIVVKPWDPTYENVGWGTCSYRKSTGKVFFGDRGRWRSYDELNERERITSNGLYKAAFGEDYF